MTLIITIDGKPLKPINNTTKREETKKLTKEDENYRQVLERRSLMKKEMKIYTTPEEYDGEPECLLYWLRRNSIYGDHSEKMLQDIQKCGNLMRGIRYSEDPEQIWSPNGYYEVGNVMSGEIEI